MNLIQIVKSLPLPMLQHREEIVAFGEWMIRNQVRSILEIGTGPGGTTVFWSHLCDRIISVDLPCDGSTVVHSQLRNLIPHFFSVIGDTQIVPTEHSIELALHESLVDLLFVDGDHRFECVKHDYETYRRFVRDGGWIAFHDINASDTWPDMGVRRFWNQLIGTKEEFVVGSYSENPPSWGGIGVIQK